MISENIIKNALNYQIKHSFHSFLIKAFDEINPGKDFIDNWHLKLFCDALTDDTKKRLIINIPPRYLKSVCFSVAFPAWYIGQNPTARIIIATYSATLSNKHASDTRRIMHSDWYKMAFPESKIINGFDTQTKFGTAQNGYYFATSVGGTLTGEGGDIIIVDDPHNPSKIHSKLERKKVQRWIQETLFSRLNDKDKGRIILVMQRLHKDDLTGFLTLKKNNWEQISLPAICEKIEKITLGEKIYHIRQIGEPLNAKKEDLTTLNSIKIDMGSQIFAAQYQQNPSDSSSGLIKQSWLKYYLDLPQNLTKIISVDCAIETNETSDYSVIATIGFDKENKHYLLDICREKLSYIDLKNTLRSVIKSKDPLAVLIEDRATGSALIRELNEQYNNIIKIIPKNDKITRFASAMIAIESGRFFLPKNTAFLDDFVDEMVCFPAVKHDDQVDTVSQYFNWLTKSGVNPKIRFI